MEIFGHTMWHEQLCIKQGNSGKIKEGMGMVLG
jgi:hypothetical protein